MLEHNSGRGHNNSIAGASDKRSNGSRADILERQIQKQVLLRKQQKDNRLGKDFLDDLKLPSVENS